VIPGDGQRPWRVSWQVGDVTYSLEYVPAEGGDFTLAQFTQLLNTLKWS
jgi:hypothetical protein